ncbi:MAG: RCC1 domain-containing protein, partial [Anaerolineaceae bacterium]
MMTARTWPRLGVSILFATALASCGGGGADGGVQQTHLGIESYSTPQVVSAGLAFVTLESSEQHVCGTVSDGSLWCWGSNAHGELAT